MYWGLSPLLTAKVISWRSMTHMCFLAFSHQYEHNFSFHSHRLIFSHASAELRGENTPERKVAPTGDRTRNHQVMSATRSPLSHPGGADNHLVVVCLNLRIFYSGIKDSHWPRIHSSLTAGLGFEYLGKNIERSIGPTFTNRSQELFCLFVKDFVNLTVTQLLIG